MRILLTADPELPVPPGLYGGVQRLVAQWASTLQARGHVVGLVAHPASSAPCARLYPWPGLRSQHLPDTLRNTRALHRAAFHFRPDVIHSSSRLLYTWPLLLADLPVVMTYHRSPGARQIRLARHLARHLVFTGVSHYIATRGRLGGGDWRAIPNCIDLDRLTFQPRVPLDAPLVFLSRIDPDKGPHLAIDIAVAAGHPLVLAGNHSADPAAARYWREQIQPRLDHPLIRYVGPVDDTAKNTLLGRARALLVPTQCDEAFGLVYAEALACGTPVIGTRRGAVPEIIEPGRNGFLADTLPEAVAAIARLDEISRPACRASAELRFSPAVVVSAYENLYRELAPGA